jgi:hypothetical protein
MYLLKRVHFGRRTAAGGARTMRIEDDARLLAMAVVRAAIDTGRQVTLEDAAARFGIDLNELAAENAEEVFGRESP